MHGYYALYPAVFGCTELGLRIELELNTKSKMERKWSTISVVWMHMIFIVRIKGWYSILNPVWMYKPWN
jgi:hypothetical protein